MNASGSEASRMVRIPLNFRGASSMTFDDYAFRNPVDWRRCGVVLRPARNHVLGRIHIGHDGLFRLPRAPGKSGQCHGTGHQRKKTTPAGAGKLNAFFGIIF